MIVANADATFIKAVIHPSTVRLVFIRRPWPVDAPTGWRQARRRACGTPSRHVFLIERLGKSQV